MALVNEIKCARCDRKYSGVRSRCPYCGARRIGRGKYSEDSDNARGKMLISVLIMAVFAVAAGVLLFTTPNDADAGDSSGSPELSTPDDDIDSLQGIHPEPTPEPTPTPEPEPVAPQEVSSLTITYDGNPRTDFAIKREEKVDVRVKVEPPGVDLNNFKIEWESSNEDQFQAVPVLINGHQIGVDVTGIATSGQATLTVRVGDMEQTCIVYSR